MGTDSTDAGRFHSMDALRASALLLGIVFHAALSFTPYRLEVTPWAVYDQSSSHLLGAIAYIGHMFRMEVFFLIAGFFAHMVYHRKGVKSFFAIRSRRILIPFVVGWLLLYPVVIYVWVWGAIKSGRLDSSAVAPAVSAWWLTIDIMSRPKEFLFDRGFTLIHLWFLYYLFALYVLLILFRRVLLSVFGDAAKIRRVADRGLRFAIASRWPLSPGRGSHRGGHLRHERLVWSCHARTETLASAVDPNGQFDARLSGLLRRRMATAPSGQAAERTPDSLEEQHAVGTRIGDHDERRLHEVPPC